MKRSNTTLTFLTLITLACALTLNGCSSILKVTHADGIEQHPGERSTGAALDDENIEVIALVNLSKADPGLDDAHINVTSYNGLVLLTGEVGNSNLKNLAQTTVKKIKRVREVYNELTVNPNSSFLSRSNDAWLTSKVKSKLLADGDIDGGRVKVVTEDSIVYLMGLLSRHEADKVTEKTRTTGGVTKVVKAIEYID